MTRKSKRASLLLVICVVSVFAVAMFQSCGDDEGYPVPEITGFSPTSGSGGIEVTITGSNFDAAVSENIVQFESSRYSHKADIVPEKSSTTSLVVKKPTDCISSEQATITVTSHGKTATSKDVFMCN